MALLKYASNIDLSRNKILNLVEARGYDGVNKDLTTGLKITTAEGTEGDLVLGTAESNTKGNVFILAGQNLEEAKAVSGTSDIDIALSQIPGIALLNDNSISLKAARKESDASSAPKIRIWGQEGVYIAKGTDRATSSLANISNLPSYIKIEDGITQHSGSSINLDATTAINLGNMVSSEAQLTECFKTATITFTDNTEGSYIEEIGENPSGIYEYTLKTTSKGVTETLPNLNITKSLTETGESVTFKVGTFVLNSPASDPTLSIIRDENKSEIISTTNTINDTLTVGKTIYLNKVDNSQFQINAEGSTYFNLTGNFDLKDASATSDTTSKTGGKGSIIHTVGSGVSRETTINVDNLNVANLVSDKTIKFCGSIDINKDVTDSDNTLNIQGASTIVTSTEVKVGEGKTTDLTIEVGNLSKTAATKIEVKSPSVTRTVNTDTLNTDAYKETIDDKGYSVIANTKYDITSNASTTLKNKALTIIAGEAGAFAEGVDSVKSSSGYYTLHVPSTTSGLSEEYIDKVNVRNLFSQTAGGFKLGDNNNNTVSRISSIILNGETLSSDLKTSVNLTSPRIEIEASNSSIKSEDDERIGRLYITSPNDFSLEVDNTNSDVSKHVSKLTIKDIEVTNSTTARGTINLGDKDNGATIKVPESLTINAVEFTLNQVGDKDNVVDNSKTSKGNAILTSKISDEEATLGKRITTLNVENATVNTSLTSSVSTTLNGEVKVNKDNTTGTLDIKGKSSSIQSNTITLGTSSVATSDLTTYIGAQTSNISKLTENISGDSTRNFQADNVKEEFKARVDEDSTKGITGQESFYSITSKVPFTVQSSGTGAPITISSIDNNNNKSSQSSLTIKGPGYTLEAPNSTSGKTTETVDNLSIKNSFALTGGVSTFSIGSDSKKAESITTYSTSTTRTSDNLTEGAGAVEGYKYSLNVGKDSSDKDISKLSIRDASFGNEVSIGTTLNLNNVVDGQFKVKALGNTYFNLAKIGTFDLKGSEIEDNTDLSTKSLIHSESTLNSDGKTYSRTTTVNIDHINVAESLNSSSTSTLTGTSATIDADAITIGKETSTLTVKAFNNTETVGTQTSTYSTSSKREFKKNNLPSYVEEIEVDTTGEGSTGNPYKIAPDKGFSATSYTTYTLSAINAFILNAGKDDNYPLIIETSESKTGGGYDQASIKTTTLNATSSLDTPIANIGSYATVGNASKGGYVDIGAIRVKYDSSSQSLIFGAV